MPEGVRIGAIALAVAVLALPGAALAAAAGAAAADKAPAGDQVEHAEPLKLRAPPSPAFSIRRLARLRERIAKAEGGALKAYAVASEEVLVELSGFPPDVWTDERNRLALVEFTVGGGDPALLRDLAERRTFPESEVSLAHGVLAYAEGHRAAASELLAKVDLDALPVSLAGAVALVMAMLLADSDVDKALEMCARARLQSPGTLVEEAANRLAIELAAQHGDPAGMQRALMRYAWRHAQSPYAQSAVASTASVLADTRAIETTEGAAWLEQTVRMMPASLRQRLLRQVCEWALRLGRQNTAIKAIEVLRSVDGQNEMPGWVVAYDGAARAVAADTEHALALLMEAERFELDPDAASLISAARILAAIISAPVGGVGVEQQIATVVADETGPDAAKAVAEAPDSVSALATTVKARMRDMDDLLQETAR